MREKINFITTKELTKLVHDYIGENNHFNRIHSRSLIKSITFNSVHFGKFMVIDFDGYEGSHILFKVLFPETGYVSRHVRIQQIHTGEIKDYLFPIIHDKGYLGERYNEIIKFDRKLHSVMYTRWVNMISRCYNTKAVGYSNYGELGVKVSDRWLNYSNYFYDVIKLPGFDRDSVISRYGPITLDKDMLQLDVPHSERIYSKDTCVWITPTEQLQCIYSDKFSTREPSNLLYFVATYPDGTEYIGHSLEKFAKSHNLCPGDCNRAYHGKINHVKHYKFRKATNEEIQKYKSL